MIATDIRAAHLAVLLTSLLLAVGCGDSADQEPTPVAPAPSSSGSGGDGQAATGDSGVLDPCTLIDSATLAQIIGSDPGVGSLHELSTDQRKACVFTDDDLSLQMVAAQFWQQHVDSLVGSAGGGHEPISGLGDDAYWSKFTPELLVLKGDRFIIVRDEADRQASIAIAEVLLAAS